MNALLSGSQPALSALCQQHHVRRLELFGSATGVDFDPLSSDLDFLVEFEPLSDGRYADHYFGLQEDLETMFGRPVELVVTRAVRNPHFLASVNRSRELLYAA